MTNEINIPTAYTATEHEGDVYQRWEDAGCFKAGAGKRDGKPTYTIVIPPPNVTGKLHMGHALNNTLQDTLIRWKRMQGYDTLWQPGTDHAGIATQSVVAKALDQEGGPTKEELGREKFLEKVWEWKEEYGGSIVNQLRKLGSSCDWSRERFTMDEGLSKAVRENFVKLYEAGLLYRDLRMVNWSPVLQTALANDEVEMEEIDGFMWKLRYPLSDGSGHIDVETTRPETFFGDTAVAVHPDDERYKDMIGKTIRLPVVDRDIPIVADEYADPTKGTGAVKITPAHDPNDNQLGKRHDLPLLIVMNLDGTMNDQCGPYAGQDRFECRKNLENDLTASGIMQGKRPIKHAVGHCYRSHVPIEPMVTEQWFVSMESLAKRALTETQEGRVKFHPQRWEKVYNQWLEAFQDWCVSRQIWWGHRIPAFYRQPSGEVSDVLVTREDPDASEALLQDEDVLDTWFSSALWPFSTLGWPEKTEELAKYYPTSTLVTDRGIIYLWVARMVMMGLFNMDERPFDDVYIHGTVLDETGTKMSKSLKNGIDPLVMIDGGAMEYHPGGVHKTPESEDYACPGYGADAVRYTLLDMTTEGQDLKLAPSRFEAGRNFANKVFNAGRFVLMNLHERPLAKLPSNDDLLQLPLGFEEQWLLDRLQSAVDACQDALTRWRFSDYVNQAYRFFRDDLCDWYLEWAKHQFKAGGQAADTAAAVLAHSFEASLRLLHPGMPFLTEYLWQELKNVSGDSAWSDSFLMTTAWPEADNRLRRDGAAEAMADLQALVSGIRQTRNEIGLPDKTRLPVTIAAPSDAGKAATWHEALAFLCDRSNAEITIGTIDDALLAEPSVSAAVGDTAVRVQFSGDIKDQLGGFIKRLEKQLQAKEKGAAGKRGRLSNEKYLAGAPPEKVQETRDMLAQDEAEIAQLQATLAALT